ncbi:hypothetical protein [Pseudomonas lurida]|uniref:hypothetical protein n=1 Tax=Pseudomonas lurida TaxID=244566 RepID=UPI0011AE8165|nr:hypothetical protein [Pseudomonas lurida]
MKKFNTRNLRHWLRAANKRFKRGNRTKGPGALGTLGVRYLNPNFQDLKFDKNSFSPTVNAPPQLDLYMRPNIELFANFLENLRLTSKYNNHVLISFRDTTTITACAGLRMLAEVSYLLKLHPNLSFGCSFGKRRTRNKKSSTEIEQILQKIGFFSAIGRPAPTSMPLEGVAVWEQLSGSLADGSLAASLLNNLPNSISKRSKAHLYKGAIEAMANSVDHAYPVEAGDNSDAENRWWMLVGKKQNSITQIVCDLGVGIPVTLPKKHEEGTLTKIFRKIGVLGSCDAELIHASTFIKRSRTNLPYRGKGAADIRSITEHFPSALLSIRSNRGCYVVAGLAHPGKIRDGYEEIQGTKGREWSASYNGSIHGTMIEWTVSLKDLEA